MKPVVSVFGSARTQPLEPAYQAACDLGHAIAAAGWTLCNGGYGGIMEATAKGAVDAGGHTIGVTCSALSWRGGPNPYVRQEVPTFDLLSRLNTLVRIARAYIVLPGGTGTLLELALVWELFNKGMLKRKAPIILYGNHWVPLIEPVLSQQPDSLTPIVVRSSSEAITVIRDTWKQETADDS